MLRGATMDVRNGGGKEIVPPLRSKKVPAEPTECTLRGVIRRDLPSTLSGIPLIIR